MKAKKTSCVLHITFHNPNSTETTAKCLTEVIADSLVNQAVHGSLGTVSRIRSEFSVKAEGSTDKAN